ncbi:hypothetical protein KNE206_55920 [Kitasatospora sp. NE20-6]
MSNNTDKPRSRLMRHARESLRLDRYRNEMINSVAVIDAERDGSHTPSVLRVAVRRDGPHVPRTCGGPRGARAGGPGGGAAG